MEASHVKREPERNRHEIWTKKNNTRDALHAIRFTLARRAYFADVATKAESATARRHEIRFQEIAAGGPSPPRGHAFSTVPIKGTQWHEEKKCI